MNRKRVSKAIVHQPAAQFYDRFVESIKKRTGQLNSRPHSARAGLSDLGIAADLFDKLKAGSPRRTRSRTGTKQDRSTLRGELEGRS
jgi:hypothetical protein